MSEVSMIGVDLAKNVFQLHAAAGDGTVLLRKKLTRSQFERFMAGHPPCTVAMEACATAHHWARRMRAFGHEVRLIAPIYVKPFVKRHKNDAADAEAIVEAATRPSMRFVEPKSADAQARAMLFRTREQLIKQRTETVNALRGHLAEFGLVAPVGIANVARLARLLEEADRGPEGKDDNGAGNELPPLAREMALVHLERIEQLTASIERMMERIKAVSAESRTARLVRTMPGIGAVGAMAIEAFAPAMSSFSRGRDFAAWLGLVPGQHTTGGKPRLGRTSKMGQRDIRRLLVIGAMSRIASLRRHPSGAVQGVTDRTGSADAWLADKLARKPRMVAAIALANKMARQLWAMLLRNEAYRTPASA
ncbi:MAG: IS110 family transposase [Pseudomonadota bacterium]